jgi:thiamine transport system permease protein
MLVALIAGWGYSRLSARSRGRADIRARPEALRPARGPGERLLLGLVVAVLLGLMLPLPALALRSLTLPAAPGAAAEPTLSYYRLLGQNRRGSLFYVAPAQAMLNSLGFGLAATALAMAIGVPAAALVARKREDAGRGSKDDGRWTMDDRPDQIPDLTALRLRSANTLDLLFTLPLGVSAVMLGLGYIVAWGPVGVLDSPLLIPAAHALLAFPFVVRTLVPALRGLSVRLREAARMLGAGRLRVLTEVELPLLTPALLSGAVFAFTASLGEFGAALLLARPEYPTVPMVIGRLLGQPGASNYGQSLALSTILMLASVAGFLLIERLRPEGVGEI